MEGKENMTRTDFSIVFMGTPEFAVAILEKLHLSGIEIKAVVTAPDKPSGRGQKIHTSAVKDYAIENSLTVLQPTNLKESDFQQELKDLNADLFVVVAFRMLPESIWSMPPKGTINLHASLLPNYRGAAPINWAVINGETETGVTTFFIEKEIDTGDIIEQSKIEIGENETVGELYVRLMTLGADVMLSTVNRIKEGIHSSIPQAQLLSHKELPAPKIFKPDCEINFTQSAQEVHNFVRGLSPYPAAWCYLYDHVKDEKKSFKLFTTRLTELAASGHNAIKSDSGGLLFPCSDFYIQVIDIQPEGKRKMSFKEFLAGNSIYNLSIISLSE
jgi:methionyl-tRNA formyltransferase